MIPDCRLFSLLMLTVESPLPDTRYPWGRSRMLIKARQDTNLSREIWETNISNLAAKN